MMINAESRALPGVRRLGVSIASAALALAAAVSTARAADASATPAAEEELTEVVITGSSIRGANPVGSNLITVGREEIEASGAQTLQQVLRGVTAITGFGNAAQGGFQSFDGAGTFAPTIHGLGASASNGTLVLVDGHRLPLTGINHTLPDPNDIAPLAIERVEVLPEGASSIYGSDAVAGVLNFITRRNYNGFEASAQVANASNYSTHSAGFLWGNSWDAGSVMLTYTYSHRGNLLAGDRAFTAANHTAQSGGNFANASCAPATVQTGAGVFAYPYTGAAVPNALTTAGFCDYTGLADLLPEDTRHNLLFKVTHDVNDSLKVSADVVWSKQNNTANINRGSITATVWGTGTTGAAAAQINPFFSGPAGATTETVRWQADDMFGPGATNKAGADTLFATLGAELKLSHDWQGSFGATIGKDDSRLRRDGALCNSCALLALNGTTNSGGNITTPSVPGTTQAVLGYPLTATNALDVWSPAASNRTSAALRAQLIDSVQLQISHQTLKDLTAKFDGPLFKLPGGDLRAAVGLEYLKYTMAEELSRERGTGPASTNSFTFFRDLGRDVKSGYVEVLVPIVGADNAKTLLKRLDVDISGRYDNYSDFGSTSNPKFAVTWGVTDGLSIRGNVARSFTAPALTSRGDANGVTAESSFGAFGFAGLQVPSTFPGIAALQALNLAGCTTGAALCTLGNAVTGIQINGGNKDLKPEKGKTYSVGFDLTPAALPGLRVSATYWSAKYEGAITAPQAAFAIAAPGLNSLLSIFPTGATQAQIAAVTGGLAQTAPLPASVYFIYSFQQRNAFNLNATGVDAEVSYRFKTGVGDFNTGVSVSRKLKMDQQFGDDGVAFSVLNTIGINTTFPSNKMAARASLGWKRNSWSADTFINYSGSYLNWGSTASTGNAAWNVIRATNPVTGAALYPIGGGQPVSAQTTVDLHVGYDFAGEGSMKGVKVFLDGSNIFNKDPPFVNTAAGYDTFNANPIGRVMTVGVSKKW
jgi:iron complex outermembrane receptor protein